jgi:hypothetical protein
MAVAQVSLVSAVKAAPVRASAGARRSARAVNVVAKAGVERFEVAKKAAPVALAVGASPPRSRRRSGDRAIGARFAPRRAARRVIARGVRSRVPIRAATPDDFRSRRRTLAGSARFANDRGSTRRPSTSRDRARENRTARPTTALTKPFPSSLSSPGTVMTATEARAAEVVAAVPQEVFATADITPVLYFGFLASSLTFATVTYVALSKIKLI